ncbi:hypothetical protein LIA77_11798 [Sarocladium implicatum]|nr:hypothetical protein LIA77_11798 [Sarocladium implicatum]
MIHDARIFRRATSGKQGRYGRSKRNTCNETWLPTICGHWLRSGQKLVAPGRVSIQRTSQAAEQGSMRFRDTTNHRQSVPGSIATFLGVGALRFGGVDGPGMDGWVDFLFSLGPKSRDGDQAMHRTELGDNK